MRKAKIPAIFIFTCALAHSQTFDAASVKLTPPVSFGMKRPPDSGGPGTKDPGRVHYPVIPLVRLLTIAYGVKGFQISGAPWLMTAKERFDITATMPPGTTNEQFHIMLQNLLAARFKLKIHRETKELPVYSMVVARNGLKMKESVASPAPSDDREPDRTPAPKQSKLGPDGFPPPHPRPPGSPISMYMITDRRGPRARMLGQGNTIQDLADRLTVRTQRPVIDATGLKAKYDFTLIFRPGAINASTGPSPAAATPAPDALPDIFTALQSQLGLRLEAKKAPIQMIVIDHIEKMPTEN